MDKRLFADVTGLSGGDTDRWYHAIMAAMDEFKIQSALSQAMFIAQVGHESLGFKRLSENLNYSPSGLQTIFGKQRFPEEVAWSLGRNEEHPARLREIADRAYGGRLGNTNPGDGWVYRGRGLIQITGKYNYEQCGIALRKNLLKEPELLESDTLAARSAAWYWDSKSCNSTCGDLVRTTEKINGPAKAGLEDRKKRFNMACKALGINCL
ncbi:glycoside hydrolase family 19 protein (plasmid) [Pantoea sp. BJ2]|uniref:Glycoside hydrolase family 19 protein n=1 Tax=Pantoea sp. BJ2 TaxID=3141322 RepID=A0AAU7U300_9GAMM